jgi:hypothetical protein
MSPSRQPIHGAVNAMDGMSGSVWRTRIIEGLGLEVATSDEAREILDLKGGDKLEV